MRLLIILLIILVIIGISMCPLLLSDDNLALALVFNFCWQSGIGLINPPLGLDICLISQGGCGVFGEHFFGTRFGAASSIQIQLAWLYRFGGVFSPFYPVIIKTSLSQCVHPDIRVQLTFIALFSYLLLEPLWILKIFDFSNYLHLENDHSLKWGKYFCRLICTARKNASNGLLETQSQRNSAAKTFMNIAVVMFSEFYLGLYAPR